MNTRQRMLETSSHTPARNDAKLPVHRAVVLGLMSGALIALGTVLELAALNCVQVQLEGPWLLSLLFSAGKDALALLLGTSDRLWLQLAPLGLMATGFLTALSACVTPKQRESIPF